MADILIRMEMPKSCGFCELRYFDGDADCCPFVGDACGYGTRHPDCPLVELPEHGDLIDLDERLTGVIYDSISDDSSMVTKAICDWLGFADELPTVVIPSNKEETE